jgi:deazaflavin-dependent oxidoreductase (nitroreductase family)
LHRTTEQQAALSFAILLPLARAHGSATLAPAHIPRCSLSLPPRTRRLVAHCVYREASGTRWVPALAGKMVWLPEHYQRPGWFTTNVFNRLVAALTRVGVSVYGSRVLEVKGRKSGEWRQTPVNLLRYVDTDYLVSPRGHTQWVKNLRASNQGRLRVGRRTEPFTAVEVADEDKPPLLRAYLKKWKFEVGVFFAGVGPESSDEELRRIAADHPVFRLTKS